MLGLRELAMVAAVVLVLYGRSGVLQSRRFQSIWPWIAPGAPQAGSARDRRQPAAGRPRPVVRIARIGDRDRRADPELFQLEGNRLFWFLTILAATAVATTIITRTDPPGRGPRAASLRPGAGRAPWLSPVSAESSLISMQGTRS